MFVPTLYLFSPSFIQASTFILSIFCCGFFHFFTCFCSWIVAFSITRAALKSARKTLLQFIFLQKGSCHSHVWFQDSLSIWPRLVFQTLRNTLLISVGASCSKSLMWWTLYISSWRYRTLCFPDFLKFLAKEYRMARWIVNILTKEAYLIYRHMMPKQVKVGRNNVMDTRHQKILILGGIERFQIKDHHFFINFSDWFSGGNNIPRCIL